MPAAKQIEWVQYGGILQPVRLETRVTELGTLEVWCMARDGKNRWKLELNIREKTAR